MPELPEVETIMRGISPFLECATIKKIQLNRADLRWPFPENFAKIRPRDVNLRHYYVIGHFGLYFMECYLE